VAELEKALRLACEEQQQLWADIETKSALMATIKEQVTEKEQALANLEAVSTLSPEEVEKLKEHEHDVLELQLSLNPNNWMSIVWLGWFSLLYLHLSYSCWWIIATLFAIIVFSLLLHLYLVFYLTVLENFFTPRYWWTPENRTFSLRLSHNVVQKIMF